MHFSWKKNTQPQNNKQSKTTIKHNQTNKTKNEERSDKNSKYVKKKESRAKQEYQFITLYHPPNSSKHSATYTHTRTIIATHYYTEAQSPNTPSNVFSLRLFLSPPTPSFLLTQTAPKHPTQPNTMATPAHKTSKKHQKLSFKKTKQKNERESNSHNQCEFWPLRKSV
jgi:hypothetical protein